MNLTKGCDGMKNLKLFFSALTVVFGILGLTKSVSTEISMPIMFVCLALTMFIASKEYKDKQQKNTAIYFLLLGVFLLAVTVYNVAPMIWGI